MKKPFLIILLVFFLFLIFLSSGGGSLSQQKLIKRKEPLSKKEREALIPKIILDRRSQSPRIIKEVNEYPPGRDKEKVQLNQENIKRILLEYLRKNQQRFRIAVANLKFRRARKAGHFWVATFRQHYKGVPVFRSRIGLVAREDAKIVSFGSNYDSSIDLDAKPTVSYENAVSAAVKSLKLIESRSVRIYGKELVVWPNLPEKTPRYSLAWMFYLETQKPNAYAHKVYFVDAHTGGILRAENALREETLKAQVRGEIWPNDPTNPTEKKPFSYLRINFEDKSQYTGSNGHFKFDGLSTGTYNFKLSLEGPYVKVYRNSGTGADDFIDNEAKLSKSVRTGQETTLDWPASDEANAFYHVNKVRNWFLEKFDFAWELPWDREGFTRGQIIVSCESGPEFNGQGGMGGIWLGSQGGKQWARSADTIYHEFTHNVILSIFDGLFISRSEDSEGYSMDEGFADYFACALNDDPIVGENVLGRSVENNEQYPNGPYALEGHEGGKIISGACWDFRKKIGPSRTFPQVSGIERADQWVFQALNILASWPPEYYFSNPNESNFLDALKIAADDGYETEILQAFRNHNLLPVDLWIADNADDLGDVPSTSNGRSADQSQDIRIDAPPFGDDLDETPVRGKENRVYVAVHNRGYLASGEQSAYLTLYWAENPDDRDQWHFIESWANIPGIASGGEITLSPFSWTPSTVVPNTCYLIAEVFSGEDRITQDSASWENNIGVKKIQFEQIKRPTVSQPSRTLVPRVIEVDPPEGKVPEAWPTKIVVKFNKDMNPDSINEETFLLIREDWQGRKRVRGTVRYDARTREATLIPAKALYPTGVQTDFFIRLKGTGAQVVTDVDGKKLDGDGDGKPGGDFTSWFRLIG